MSDNDDVLDHLDGPLRSEFVETFVEAYLVCALWSSLDEDGLSLDESADLGDFDPEAVQEAREDCRAFIGDNADDLADLDPAQCGHDFWLTRNHHGAGFWDRGLGERGDRLTTAAHTYSNVDLFLGDNGKVYSS